MKIVIGYDGSQYANDAIADLKRAGLPADTEATLLSCADLFLPISTGGVLAEGPSTAAYVSSIVGRASELGRAAMDDARELSRQGETLARTAFPTWTVRTQASTDPPHSALAAEAEASEADLIVVGSHGRGAVGRVLFGSVSQQVLQHSPCSVRIGRAIVKHPDANPSRPVRLVLGIDNSVDSATAASAVSIRAWPKGSEVLVVSVMDSHTILAGVEFRPAPGVDPDVAVDLESQLQKSLNSVADELRRSGLIAKTSLLAGDPKRVLLKEAEGASADCIFIGAKGHSRLARLLLGSVSSTIAARAECSVEVVRTGAG